MSRPDAGISLSNSRSSLDRRNPLIFEGAKTTEAEASGSRKVTVDLKDDDDDDDVQIISPRALPEARMPKRNRRRAAGARAPQMDLELSIGTSASLSHKSCTRLSRNAIIDLTAGNDEDAVPLTSRKRKAARIAPEPSKDVQLTCAICMDTMKEETSTVCGHIFCRPCILGAIKTQKKCPTCRRKLANSNIHRIYLSSGTR